MANRTAKSTDDEEKMTTIEEAKGEEEANPPC